MSFAPGMQLAKSYEFCVGTMRSLSPLTTHTGIVIFDKSSFSLFVHTEMALSCARIADNLMGVSLSLVRFIRVINHALLADLLA